MSNNFRHIDHPLRRGGLSRPERDNPALDPASAPADGRGLGDLLRFWFEYARQVDHFTVGEDGRTPEITGDWLDFFRRSVPFQYANIGAFDLEELEKRYVAIYDAIGTRRTFAALNPLLDLLLEMASQLSAWREDLVDDGTGLKDVIDGLMSTGLREPMTRLLGLANGAAGWGYRPSISFGPLKNYGLSPTASFAVDRGIIGHRGSPKNKVLAGRELLTELYRTFWKALEATVATARDEDNLEATLRAPQRNDEPAHLGLVFAFLLLYRDTQAGINQLGEKHLDFFYRKTLQLKEQPLVPDLAHLILEPAKQLEESLLLRKGLSVKGGKDANGKEILFELEEDFVLTRTRIAERRTLFIDPHGLPEANLYAAPLADTGDGVGGGFPKEVPAAWPTLGAATATYPDPETERAAAMPVARVGLMVASPALLLREGKRTVTVTFTFGAPLSDPPPEDLNQLFDLRLTTEEGWLAVPQEFTTTPSFTTEAGIDDMVINLTLPPDFPAVIHPPEVGVLPEKIPHAYPALQLLLNESAPNRGDCYCRLGQLPVTGVKIDVTVCGVRQLAVQNDLAVLDAAKPFQPFGPTPVRNFSSFYVGSEEVFAKHLTKLDLELAWLNQPYFNTYYNYYLGNPVFEVKPEFFLAAPEFKTSLEWKQDGLSKDVKLFDQQPGKHATIELADSDHKILPVTWPVKLPLDIANSASSGVLRLKLKNQDFLHEWYAQSLLQVAQININRSKELPPKPPVTINPPYTPTLAAISMDYKACETLGDRVLFGHVHPWTGGYEWNTTVKEGGDAGAEQGAERAVAPLLPAFPGEGHLFLGLADYQPGELVNLYFELDAPTADPRLEKATVEWAYLRGNEWRSLADELQVLEDTTDGLLRSGIVKISPPSDISREGTTVLSPAYHWLRASVPARAAAIAATLKVSARAVAVRALIDPANDAGRLATPLVAGALAKTTTAVTGLKGLEQLYPSFGGKAPEAPAHFNRRVSELLRHKGRAITLSDYEHMVLEAFPDVYRVKCLTHTLGVRGRAKEDLEMAPGHVTLVVIPDPARVSAVNVFEPRLPAAGLEAIREYLTDKISPCIDLRVLNPEYEAVQLSLDVCFRPGKSAAFYKEQLQKDLRGLLAPWTRPDAAADITFGGKFFYSTAVHFIERLAYVDFVRNLHIVDPAPGGGPLTFQAARRARSVLTTANGPVPTEEEENPPPTRHLINVIEQPEK